jgi:hypothetical protein
LSLEIIKPESIYCPEYKGKRTHKHVLWAAQFFKDFEDHLKTLLVKDNISPIDDLMRLVPKNLKMTSEGEVFGVVKVTL